MTGILKNDVTTRYKTWMHIKQYSAVITLSIFPQNFHNRYPIAHRWQWGMECLLWIQTLIYVLHQSLKNSIEYHNILNCIMASLNCTWVYCMLSVISAPAPYIPYHIYPSPWPHRVRIRSWEVMFLSLLIIRQNISQHGSQLNPYCA